jgi:hypothetical protein
MCHRYTARTLVGLNLVLQVFSPNYPFPYQPYIVCRYFIYGMQDSQNLERVALTFDKFDIPVAGKAVAKTPTK